MSVGPGCATVRTSLRPSERAFDNETRHAGLKIVPNLTVRCGEASILLEAKRLIPTTGSAEDYVNEGMMRFLDGRYVPPGEGFGLMLSYIIRGTPGDCYEAVNDVIRVHPNLGPDEVTTQREALRVLSIYVSEHKTTYIDEITHYAIDVRSRQPSTLQSQGVATEGDGDDSE